MRIHPSSTFLLDIVNRVQRGEIVAAAFQRPYVWTRDDVTALWRSLLAGWPIGSILLWQPDRTLFPLSKFGRSRIGPIATQSDSEYTPYHPTGLLLDGQQRLTSIAWSFLQPGAPRPDHSSLYEAERQTWSNGQSLVVDIPSRSVIWVPDDEAAKGLRLPAGILADSASFMKSIRMLEDRSPDKLSNDDLEWLDDAAQTVRSGRLSMTTIEGGTPAEAIEAFIHVARTGVPVSHEDIAAALAWPSS